MLAGSNITQPGFISHFYAKVCGQSQSKSLKDAWQHRTSGKRTNNNPTFQRSIRSNVDIPRSIPMISKRKRSKEMRRDYVQISQTLFRVELLLFPNKYFLFPFGDEIFRNYPQQTQINQKNSLVKMEEATNIQ